MLANIVIEYFQRGGLVMWPILICAVVLVAVIGERLFWWWRETRLRDHDRLMQVLDALHKGNVEEAAQLAKGSHDPVVQMVEHVLNDHATSLQIAMQAAAGVVLRRAGRFIPRVYARCCPSRQGNRP